MATQTITEARNVSEDRPQRPSDGTVAFSVAEIAERLSVSEGFVRLEIARGALRPLRLGRRVLISCRELERYVAARTDIGKAGAGRELIRR
jgi:excisionase family DNA binding protein